ncbi:MAG: hypothetical protein M5U34_10825 [Chloroflexi bacterium]|nr:hypothetical protein [Chloroflexota bacterium]
MTIYDWVTRFDSWRGEPAALLIMATAVFILLIPDARLAILGLAVQYLALALLYLDVMEPRLVMVKLLVGWFVCLMLTITGSQVHWGLLPEDVSPDEVAGMSRSLSFEVKGRRVSITAVRALLALVMLGAGLAVGAADGAAAARFVCRLGAAQPGCVELARFWSAGTDLSHQTAAGRPGCIDVFGRPGTVLHGFGAIYHGAGADGLCQSGGGGGNFLSDSDAVCHCDCFRVIREAKKGSIAARLARNDFSLCWQPRLLILIA